MLMDMLTYKNDRYRKTIQIKKKDLFIAAKFVTFHLMFISYSKSFTLETNWGPRKPCQMQNAKSKALIQ